MQKLLIIEDSHTGQTRKMVDEFVAGLGKNAEITRIALSPKKPFAFPWKIKEFFRVFVRCNSNYQIPLKDISIPKADYDLIVIAYPIWFLAPALCIQSFLKSEHCAILFENKNVLGLISARNMWISAVKKVNQQLKNFGAKCIQNFVLCDTSPTWATFVTTPRWLLTGKKEAFGPFPEAGIQQECFKKAADLGDAIGKANGNCASIKVRDFSHTQTYPAMLMEMVGRKYFDIAAHCVSRWTRDESAARDLLLVFVRAGLIF